MGLQRVFIAEENSEVVISAKRVLVHGIPPPSGLEILSEFRLVQPSCRRILTSARLTVSTLIDAINRGEVHRVLPKPLDPSCFHGVAPHNDRRQSLPAGWIQEIRHEP